MRNQAASDVKGNIAQCFSRHCQRPGPVHMLVGASDPNSGRQHGIQTIGDGVPDYVSEHCVSPKRQMAPMLFDRAERNHHHPGAAFNEAAQLRARHFFQRDHGFVRQTSYSTYVGGT